MPIHEFFTIIIEIFYFDLPVVVLWRLVMGWWRWGPVLAWTARTRGWRTFVVGLQKIFITIIEQVEENHAVGRHISLLSLNNTAKNLIWLKFLNFHPWKWPRLSEFKRDNCKEGLKVRSKRPKNVPSVVDLGSLKIFQPILPIKGINTKSFFTVYGKSPCHAGFYVMYQNISFS